jgi:SsrA-binding protein
MILTGPEVKSIKSGNVSLSGAYVTAALGRIDLINCHIGPYKYAPNEKYDPTHSRRLLLNHQEIISCWEKKRA